MQKTVFGSVRFAIAVHVVRFGIIVGGLLISPALGIHGWYKGLFVNVLCSIYAAALVTRYGLWRPIGFLTRWRSRSAAVLLLIPLAEALLWISPHGLDNRAPGFGLWGLSLLLVGFNEELISRGLILSWLSRSLATIPAVAVTASLFGLQHLSAFATSNRGVYDILTNVLVSGCYGFALASFQYRFSWIWPLMLIHGLSDFTTILTRSAYGDPVVAATMVTFLSYGLLVLRPVLREQIRTAPGEGAISASSQRDCSRSGQDE